ncbi:unnamed protein product [Cercospora beticola]|nr:unnamed protein product [Cercospora beticola]
MPGDHGASSSPDGSAAPSLPRPVSIIFTPSAAVSYTDHRARLLQYPRLTPSFRVDSGPSYSASARTSHARHPAHSTTACLPRTRARHHKPPTTHGHHVGVGKVTRTPPFTYKMSEAAFTCSGIAMAEEVRGSSSAMLVFIKRMQKYI